VPQEKAISISTLIPTSRLDEVSYLLWELGILGLQELPPEDELYLPQAGTEFREPQRPDDWTKDERLIETATTRLKIFIPESKAIFSDIKAFLDKEALPLLSSEEILPEKYIEEYKKRVRGRSFGKNLWIGPPWVGNTPSSTHFIVDPGMAFGTGEHPTTQMIVEWLEENRSRKFSNILDIGAGSGILSIAARRFFPDAKITATDLDLNCEEEIPKNFLLNELTLKNTRILCGEKADLTALVDSQEKFDLILSNIYGEVLAKLAPAIRYLLSQEGIWVATGVLEGIARETFESATTDNFKTLTNRERRDEAPNDSHLWHCYEKIKV
jgi:ribosomal protein L11 methyltransferase